MEQFIDFLDCIDKNFIDGIFISVILILLVKRFLKIVDINIALNIISYIILFYSILTTLYLILIIVFKVNSNLYFTFIKRATGIYKFIYILLLFLHSFLPLLLFFKKIRTKIYFVFFISVFMNLGWLFESFVIHVTSLHRDYADETNALLPFNRELIIIAKGFILGIFALIIGHIFEKYKLSKL